MAKLDIKLDVNSIVQNTPKKVDELPEKTPTGYMYECDGYLYVGKETKQYDEDMTTSDLKEIFLIRDNLLKCAEDSWNSGDDFYLKFADNENYTRFYTIKAVENKRIVFTKDVYNEETDEQDIVEEHIIYDNGKWYKDKIDFGESVCDEDFIYAGEERSVFVVYSYDCLPNQEQRELFTRYLIDIVTGNFTEFNGVGFDEGEEVYNFYSTFKGFDFVKLAKYESVYDFELNVNGTVRGQEVNLINTFFSATLTKDMFREMFNGSKIINLKYAFCECKIDEIDFSDIDTSGCGTFERTFSGCTASKIKGLDMSGCINNYSNNEMFNHCKNLTELELYNIKKTLYLHTSPLLTLDSLIHTCKECVKHNNSTFALFLTTESKEKLSNVYVKFVDSEQTTIATGEKGEVEVCNAEDEGAMLISEYMALKNWQIR